MEAKKKMQPVAEVWMFHLQMCHITFTVCRQRQFTAVVWLYFIFLTPCLQKKAKPEKKELGVITYDIPTPSGEKKGEKPLTFGRKQDSYSTRQNSVSVVIRLHLRRQVGFSPGP